MIQILAADLLFALGDNHPQVTNYLNRETGEIIPIFVDMFEPGDPEYIDEEALMDDPHYVPIEPISSHDAFRWMEQFAAGVADNELRAQLYAALEKRRPFRGFKDVLLTSPADREAWFAFEETHQLEEAKAWLASEGIEAELTSRIPPKRQESTS